MKTWQSKLSEERVTTGGSGEGQSMPDFQTLPGYSHMVTVLFKLTIQTQPDKSRNT